MRLSAYTLVVCIIALSSRVQSASAQFVWNVSVSSTSDMQTYYFYGLSCQGPHCTVCGVHQDEKNASQWLTFFRSDDGGRKWDEQNPQLSSDRFPTKILWVVQQIDSANVVAGGDSGLVARTIDAGKTWRIQPGPMRGKVMDISFSDSLHGMICVRDSVGLYLTSDGGSSWKPTAFGGGYLWQGHSYGKGKFRAFRYGWGPIYSTLDNWVTVDSTQPVFDYTRPEESGKILALCKFGVGDTLLAYGLNRPPSSVTLGLIYRSSDGGHSWKESVVPKDKLGPIHSISSLERDTLYAAGDMFHPPLIFYSVDNGSTWQADSLKFDTTYTAYTSRGIESTSAGNLVGAFSDDPLLGQAILAYRTSPVRSVETYERIVYGTHIYPNPAQDFVTIVSNDPLREIRLCDVLGRPRLQTQLPADGQLKLDISKLGAGIYSIQLNHDGVMVPVGKLAVIGK